MVSRMNSVFITHNSIKPVFRSFRTLRRKTAFYKLLNKNTLRNSGVWGHFCNGIEWYCNGIAILLQRKIDKNHLKTVSRDFLKKIKIFLRYVCTAKSDVTLAAF